MASACIPSPHNPYYSFPEFRTRSQAVWGSLDQNHVHPDGDPFLHRSRRGSFSPTKPADWPTATQPAPAPAYTVASTSDPYLEELSKAYNNSGVSAFTSDHKGDMTWYAQGSGACGDVYDDTSFTAAVSHFMYDAWPGADTNETNRKPNLWTH
ncbi:hypothetical protein B0H14DRAFT_3449054 [Mycena olivaceomarginata]|nr:hypothetical protein B0H14DRAFT_3449054 [Mycena olivaceomarginata]